MNGWKKGVLLGVVQVALVASLGAKLRWDRAHLPRVWARIRAYDPELPIRGRYLAMQLEVIVKDPAVRKVPAPTPNQYLPKGGLNYGWEHIQARLRVEDGRLVADPSEFSSQTHGVSLQDSPTGVQIYLDDSVLYFLPEHAADPWQQARDGELWAEVTVPPNGPPRPIRLAIKRGGSFTPLEIR